MVVTDFCDCDNVKAVAYNSNTGRIILTCKTHCGSKSITTDLSNVGNKNTLKDYLQRAHISTILTHGKRICDHICKIDTSLSSETLLESIVKNRLERLSPTSAAVYASRQQDIAKETVQDATHVANVTDEEETNSDSDYKDEEEDEEYEEEKEEKNENCIAHSKSTRTLSRKMYNDDDVDSDVDDDDVKHENAPSVQKDIKPTSNYPQDKANNNLIKKEINVLFCKNAIMASYAIPGSIIYLDGSLCCTTSELIKQGVASNVPLIIPNKPDFEAVSDTIKNKRLATKVSVVNSWLGDYIKDHLSSTTPIAAIWADYTCTLGGKTESRPFEDLRILFKSGALRTGSVVAFSVSCRNGNTIHKNKSGVKTETMMFLERESVINGIRFIMRDLKEYGQMYFFMYTVEVLPSISPLSVVPTSSSSSSTSHDESTTPKKKKSNGNSDYSKKKRVKKSTDGAMSKKELNNFLTRYEKKMDEKISFLINTIKQEFTTNNSTSNSTSNTAAQQFATKKSHKKRRLR